MNFTVVKPLMLVCLLFAGLAMSEERRVMMIPAIHIPPYYILDKGKYSGISVEITRLLAEKLNWNVDFGKCPLKRCYLLAQEGQLDIATYVVIENKFDSDHLHHLQPPIRTDL